MKVIIQIPCYNEEKTLPAVFRDLPSSIVGVDVIETQIIDDGSNDKTVEVAENLGVDHIVRMNRNKGLAAAFKAGVDNALKNGADILINTDGDNQYCGADVARLVDCMIQEKADMVVGCRPILDHPEFSGMKKLLQIAGSWVVRVVSKTSIPDAASGFRAYSRDALMRLNIVSTFSYCMETLIQAGNANMKVAHTPIRVNPKTRDSRLFRNIPEYLLKQIKTIVSMFILYRSNVFFGILSLCFFLPSVFLALRYLYLIMFLNAPLANFWPSVILSGILLVIGCLCYLSGVLASLFAAQRKLSEETIYHIRRSTYGSTNTKTTIFTQEP